MDATTYTAFAERFGADQADAIVSAAEEHDSDIHSNRGSDPFRWALLITIGYECWSKDRFRDYHGITAPADEIRQWIKDEVDVGSHDGDWDYLSKFCGVYQEYAAASDVEGCAT